MCFLHNYFTKGWICIHETYIVTFNSRVFHLYLPTYPIMITVVDTPEFTKDCCFWNVLKKPTNAYFDAEYSSWMGTGFFPATKYSNYSIIEYPTP